MKKVIKNLESIPVMGLWDIGDLQVPALCPVKSVKRRLVQAINQRGIERSVDMIAAGNEQSLTNQKLSRELPIYLKSYLPTRFREQAIKAMLEQWSKQHEEGEYVALLANSGVYVDTLAKLEEKSQRLLLFGHDDYTSPLLIKKAYIYWKWNLLLEGHDFMGTKMRED